MRAEATVPPELGSPRIARHWLAGNLRRWAPQSDNEDAILLVSELVTNAVIHAGTPCSVVAELEDEVLRVEVADGTPYQPAQPESPSGPDLAGETGRGVSLVARIAREWGWRRTEQGKVVWFKLHVC